MQTTSITDYLTPEIEQLIALAARVINEHVNDRDLCAICGSAWPCEQAVFAEHNLATL